jgi:hypothetical protein
VRNVSARRAGTLLAILALFGVPFYLRQADPSLEPYPAVLFPAGEGKLDIGGGVVAFQRIELLSLDPEGESHELSPSEFLSPIPVQYWPGIATRGFGLVGKKHSRAELVETIQWLRARLAAAGRERDRAITVRSVSLLVDTATGKQVERRVAWSFDVAVR